MAWEVRFYVDGRAYGDAAGGAPSSFRAEAHARFLLHRAPGGCAEVIDRDTRRRAVYRLRGGRMVALADAS